MKERLTMSNKEIDRLKAINSIVQKQLTWQQAAIQLDLSKRHIGRLVSRILNQGNKGIIHRLRGNGCRDNQSKQRRRKKHAPQSHPDPGRRHSGRRDSSRRRPDTKPATPPPPVALRTSLPRPSGFQNHRL